MASPLTFEEENALASVIDAVDHAQTLKAEPVALLDEKALTDEGVVQKDIDDLKAGGCEVCCVHRYGDKASGEGWVTLVKAAKGDEVWERWINSGPDERVWAIQVVPDEATNAVWVDRGWQLRGNAGGLGDRP